MRFKYFLVENRRIYSEPRTKEISLDDAIKIAKKECSDILNYYTKNHHSVIYRGTRGNYNPAAISDPTKGRRLSANTKNYITLFVDNNKKWKDYPKRSKSLICTTDMHQASGYGTPYMVLPYNNCKIGIVPDVDWWWGFLQVLPGILIDEVNIFISIIAGSLGYDTKELEKDFKKFEEFVKFIKIDDVKDFNSQREFINQWEKSNKEYLYDFLNDVIDPKKAGFTSTTPKNFKYSPKKEVWIGEGKCLMIKDIYQNDFFSGVKNE